MIRELLSSVCLHVPEPEAVRWYCDVVQAGTPTRTAMSARGARNSGQMQVCQHGVKVACQFFLIISRLMYLTIEVATKVRGEVHGPGALLDLVRGDSLLTWRQIHRDIASCRPFGIPGGDSQRTPRDEDFVVENAKAVWEEDGYTSTRPAVRPAGGRGGKQRGDREERGPYGDVGVVPVRFL